MRTFFTLRIIFWYINTHAQFVEQKPPTLGIGKETHDISPKINRNFSLIESGLMNSNYTKTTTIGSPYIDADFREATVNNGETKFKLRYNNNKDIIEYQKTINEIIFLDKSANTLIEFTNGKKLYLKDVKYGKKTENGYFENVIKGNNISIYKNQKVTFFNGVSKNNGYNQNATPEYKPEIEEILYPIETPKDIVKLLPNQEKELKKYLKENKVNLESITDMRKFIGFIDEIY